MRFFFVLALFLFVFASTKKLKQEMECKHYCAPNMDKCNIRRDEKVASNAKKNKGYIFSECKLMEYENDSKDEDGIFYCFNAYRGPAGEDNRLRCLAEHFKLHLTGFD